MDQKTLARFWTKVDKDGPIPRFAPQLGPCWVWTASKREGYGAIKVAGKVQGAHRLIFIHLHGELAARGLDIDHQCRNRACVNPEHLRAVSRSENMQNRDARSISTSTGVLGVERRENGSYRVTGRYGPGARASIGTFASSEEAARASFEWRKAHQPNFVQIEDAFSARNKENMPNSLVDQAA